ncbi:MAG: extracellular solute-binding protein [Chloroflexia bacterium]|nr:extracellular solute-binding protein [Chloroflexia bacterium]
MADAGLDTREFFAQFFPAYMAAHPNITVQYDNLRDNDLRTTVTAGLQNGNAPDIFRLPGGLPLAQLVSEGQVAALDDVIPNFAAWKEAFPASSFAEGINVFNGQTYTFPHLSPRYFGSMLFYNTAYMQQAGYDPVAKSLTWDEFRDAAMKITAQGAGQYYGFLLAGGVTGRWSTFVNNLARMTTPAGPGSFDWRTGQRIYTSDAVLAAIDLLLAMNSDGSIFPGSISLSQQEAVANMPQGVAGMFLTEASNIGSWRRDNPDFEFGVASQPQPNSGTVYPLTTGPAGMFWVVYGQTQLPGIAGDLLSFIGSEAGQSTWQSLSAGGPPLSFPAANEIEGLPEQAQTAYALYEELVRIGPEPAVRNPDVALVRLESRAVTPDFGETIQGIFTGQLDDARQAMQDLEDREEQELQRAIKAAQDKGAQVSRDDWTFPNWDPTRDYTEADYAALS